MRGGEGLPLSELAAGDDKGQRAENFRFEPQEDKALVEAVLAELGDTGNDGRV